MDVSHGVCNYKNINGVTCYMNSILSILQQTPYFVDYILSSNYNIEVDKKEDLYDKIIFQLFKIFKISLSNDNATINLISFRKTLKLKNPMWAINQQQDSQEFLTFLFNEIESEIKNKKQFIPGRLFNPDNKEYCLERILASLNWESFLKNEYSFIKEIFTGQIQGITKCDYCNYTNNNFEIFQNIQLNINDSCFLLDDCFKLFNKSEQLDLNNMIYCENCYIKNRAHKSNKLWRLPKILIINLKRFNYNNYGMISSKNTKYIKYPIYDLDLSEFINENSQYKSKCKYNLFAVNNHHTISGINTINSGHYTSTIKSRYDNEWYVYDDSNVSKAKMENIVSEKAYLLFYLREN
jgi:ubiquitin C-terminal hydrolase